MKHHHFGVDIAQAFGIHAALLFDYVGYWVARNEEEGQNIRNGVAWVHTTPMALTAIYPYLSKAKIKSTLQKLRDAGLIVCGGAVDTTKGRFDAYTLTKKGEALYYGP